MAKKVRLALAFLLFTAPISSAVEKPAAASSSAALGQRLALAAFKSPSVPFQAKLILTEWRNGETRADEISLSFTPPNSYRIEFLGFDGSVKKVVLTNQSDLYVGIPSSEKGVLVGESSSSSNFLTPQRLEDLLVTNYSFEVKNSETFIGRPVWVVHLVPRTPGKPLHELKIDKETLVVLEQRRYVEQDRLGSLTRFSTFEPNKAFTPGTFSPSGEHPLLQEQDSEIISSSAKPTTPPDSFRELPAGFSLNGYRTFEVEGTTANHFTYTDGALPLSIFETTLPVRFPNKVVASKEWSSVEMPANYLSSADQVIYGRKGKNYFTIIGEMSPDLLHTIANHFD